MSAAPTTLLDVLADLGQTALTVAAPLIGAWIGAQWQAGREDIRAKRQRRDKLEDEAVARQVAEAEVEDRRSSVRLQLALYLEGFAKACAEAISDNDDPQSPGSGLPDWKPWPDIDWRLLGPAETARIRDIEVRVALRRSYLQGDLFHNAHDDDDAQGYINHAAARIGLEAWNVAAALREQAGVSPFEWPPEVEGWNYVETLLTAKRQADAFTEAQRRSLDELMMSSTAE